MRVRLTALRRRRIAVTFCVLLVVGPLAVGEAFHLWRWGHLGIGLHTDLASYKTGSPTHVGYSLWGSNLTPLPLPVRVCMERGDSGMRALFRYRIELWNSETSRWGLGSSMDVACEGMGHPTWKVWWPGTSLPLIPGETGYRSHRPRFTVFTLWDRPDDSLFQIRLVSERALVSESAGLR